ncbi:MAG: NAD(P)/FAD-dependent oxidoreductase [Clostridia bacterium]|nr:NAD(P)/FAD-dependent oxidoreductase [Clostridia bacterium]
MADTVIVVGGGAAGTFAACTAAELGASVTLIERNQRIGRKVMITGKGRCNLTNYQNDLQELIRAVPCNPKFLYSAFSQYMPEDTMARFEALGVPLKVERGNRVFPESDKAVDIVDAMERDLRKHRVRRVCDRVRKILVRDGRVVGVEGEKCGSFSADAVILATGGVSYPRTGSTGDGYEMARALGHTIVPPKPSLVPMLSDDPCCRQMQGLSLRNVAVSVRKAGEQKPVYEDFGEMLFTHFGVSGPLILSASSHLRTLDEGGATLTIDLKPALDEAALDKRIRRDFEEQSNRDFQNALGKLLPRKMIPVVVERSGIAPDKVVHQITREERAELVRCIKEFSIHLTGFRPVREAIITSGGVSVREIDPGTMASKRVHGLYFAGEVIDVDAYTGGYNLQIAFSTGYLAGCNAVYDS